MLRKEGEIVNSLYIYIEAVTFSEGDACVLVKLLFLLLVRMIFLENESDYEIQYEVQIT